MGAGAAADKNVPAEFDREFPEFKEWQEIAPGFWHLRVPFIVKKGPVKVDISSHMSACRLSSGGIACIDACTLTPGAKAELDKLTENGTKIETSIHTHPFHTLAIPAFHSYYPASETRKYYGCPRHLRNITQDADGNTIVWAGDLNCCDARNTFEPDLAMQVPAGAEFVNPTPEKTNHFAAVFVLHRASKTLHVDDCLIFVDKPSILMRAVGVRSQKMLLHPAMKGPGLYPTEKAPLDFQTWLSKLCDDWDFENVATAHIGTCFGCGKEKVQCCLANASKDLLNLSEKNAKGEKMKDNEWHGEDVVDTPVGDDGVECG